MAVPAILVTRIGWKAQAALAATRGRAHVLAPLSTSLYLTAGDEVVWLGRPGGVPHPRAMLTTHGRLGRYTQGEAIGFDLAGARPWLPRRSVPVDDPSIRTATTRALLSRLRERPDCVPEPLGLGALLVGRDPAFPLDRAVPAAIDLARACDADRVTEATAAADRLLGLGPGLTPAGDDFVGGVLFARNRVGGAASADWRQAGSMLVARARQRTNLISITLLTDLAEGHGHEPLHDLAEALERRAGDSHALDALHRLAGIGHSSGWDLLAGFFVGIAGIAALGRR
ncbi:MAG: DUF2877 domain-containing protein [Candidatus Rokuibacteriota bacterium]